MNEPKDLPPLEQMLLLDLNIGLLTTQNRIDRYEDLRVQQYAFYFMWTIKQGTRVRVPGAWLTASLETEWTLLPGVPSEWVPTTLTARIDDESFFQFVRRLRNEKKTI